jgi:hypothetical protein
MKIKDLTEPKMSDKEKLESEQYVLKMNIKDIVALTDWQKLRAYFVGKWKKQPKKNLEMLKMFATNKEIDDELFDTDAEPSYTESSVDLTKLSNRRLRIVQNYVTGSGFRIGIISSKEITDFVEQVRKEVADRKIRDSKGEARWK